MAVYLDASEHLDRARSVVARLRQLAATATLLDVAAQLGPPQLRSLDAVHVASALALGPELVVFISYDDRQRAAAEARGLPTLAPS